MSRDEMQAALEEIIQAMTDEDHGPRFVDVCHALVDSHFVELRHPEVGAGVIRVSLTEHYKAQTTPNLPAIMAARDAVDCLVESNPEFSVFKLARAIEDAMKAPVGKAEVN